MWIIKIVKLWGFYPPRILNEHWCIYSCLQIPPRENWFQYVRRVYTTAINFPCILILIYSNCINCVLRTEQRLEFQNEFKVYNSCKFSQIIHSDYLKLRNMFFTKKRTKLIFIEDYVEKNSAGNAWHFVRELIQEKWNNLRKLFFCKKTFQGP